MLRFRLEIRFGNKKLESLYSTGKSTKYRLEKHILNEFFEVLAILEAARDIHDLWKMPGINFEKLKGYTNRYSARLSQKWRLEMEIE